MMHTYFAYGLGIHSEIELPELAPAHAAVDVIIRTAHLEFSADQETQSGVFDADAEQVRVNYAGIAAFALHHGAEIEFEPAPNVNPQELRLMLLGPVWAMLLHQRGRLVLHASSVALKQRAIAFLAEAGEGKSTIAAALLARGYQLVTDDLLAINPDSAQRPSIYPGFPFLKISTQAARALGQNLDAAPRVSARLDKRVWQIDDAPTSPVELECIYVLKRGEQPRIEMLAPQEAFIALVRHTFVARLLDATEATQKHFQQCSILTRQIPIYRLSMPSSLEGLAKIAELVDKNLRFPAL